MFCDEKRQKPFKRFYSQWVGDIPNFTSIRKAAIFAIQPTYLWGAVNNDALNYRRGQYSNGYYDIFRI